MMTEYERNNHTYIGDAVYAEWDGFYIILRTNSHLDTDCDQKIYLEDDVMKRLFQFYTHHLEREIIKEHKDDKGRAEGNKGLLEQEVP